MTRTLVTGGTGFVGRAVVRRLRTGGLPVSILSRALTGDDASPVRGAGAPARGAPGVEVRIADLTDREAVARVVRDGGFEVAVHLAALTRVRDSVADPLGYYAVNLGGTANLLAALDEQARRTGRPARLVFASTGAVYGAREGRLGEDEPAAPAHPYAAAKHAAEQLIGFQAATGRLAATTLRCFNVAGALPGQPDPDPTRLIPQVLAAASGAGGALRVNGDGSAVREYTHVADVADAFALALAALGPPGYRVFNVGAGVGTSVADVVAAVERVTGRPVPVERRPAAAESPLLLGDSRRIRAELGWAPVRSDLDRLVADGWAALGHT